MQSLFGTPHKLIQKWRDKYSDSIRLYQSNPEIAMQAKQVFSALNAQLMAELPKVSKKHCISFSIKQMHFYLPQLVYLALLIERVVIVIIDDRFDITS